VWRSGMPVNNDSFACGKFQSRSPIPTTASGPLQDELACEVQIVRQFVSSSGHEERATLELRSRPHRFNGESEGRKIIGNAVTESTKRTNVVDAFFNHGIEIH